MQQKLLRKAGLLGMVLLLSGVVLTGCIDEPNPPVLDRITSEVRFVHAVPDAPAVDIWVDNEPVVTNVSYKAASGYLTVNSGTRFFRVVPAGQDSSNAVFRRQVSVRSLTKMTVAFFNTVSDVALLMTQERFTYADETSILVDSCDVKLINLNSRGEAFGISKDIGASGYEEIIFPVQAGFLSAYNRIPVQSGDFYASRENGTVDLDSQFPFTFEAPGYRYTFIIVGDSGQLEVLRLQDEPVM
jgi:hypothetical protein